MSYYIIDSPFSSSLGQIQITQGSYLDPTVQDAAGDEGNPNYLHAGGYDAAALDFGMGLGKTVLSMANGIIVDVHTGHAAGSGGTHGFGNYVTIKHSVTPVSGGPAYTFYATYAHLDDKSLFYLKWAFDLWTSYGLQMPVSAGDTLGSVGNAGYATHLHVQFGTSITDDISGISIADARVSAGNTTLLNSLMISGSLIGPGGVTVAQVETGDLISSLNENTGEIPGQFLPAGTGGGGAPDLLVSHVELGATGASPGSNIEVSFDIGNLGDISSTVARGEIVMSTTPDFTGTVHLLDTFNISSLEANGQPSSLRHYSETVTIPVSLGRTNYYIGVRADYQNTIAELNEGNNFSVSSALAVGGGLSGDPDLRVSLSAFPDGVRAAGDALNVTFNISADADGSIPYTYRVYFSENETLGPDDALLYEETTTRGLGYFGVHYYSHDFILPLSARDGVGYVFVQADPSNVIAEQREDNNLRSRPIVISPDAADSDSLPDLFADYLHLPAIIYSGEQFRYAIDWANLSADDSLLHFVHPDGQDYSFQIALLMSSDPIISSDDRVIHIGYEWDTFPGNYRTSSSGHNITLPTDIESGRYYFSAVIDYGQDFLEEREGNNIAPPILVEIVNNIPSSIDAVDDDISLVNVSSASGNVLSNDIYQLFSTPIIDRINGSSIAIGSELHLTSGAVFLLNADGNFILSAADIFAGMNVGSSVTETLTYRVAGAGGDVSAATIRVTFSRANPDFGTSGNDHISGTEWDDQMDGFEGDDSLSGGAGNDTLIGGAGADLIVGGEGGDTVKYTNASSSVVVQLGRGSAHGSDIGVDQLQQIENVIGGVGSDIISGDGLSNILDGYSGADIIAGGPGNDTYVVDNSGDQVMELSNSGIDAVHSAVSYDMMRAWHVENLTLTGDSAINGSGNWLDNLIAGNNGANVLIGNRGNDTLDGGAGIDTLLGGEGNDVLIWDAADASIQGGSGADTLRIAGGGVAIDLTSIGDGLIQDIEVINIQGAGGNTLTLTIADVLAISSTTDLLRVDGDSGVVNRGSGWSTGADQVIGLNAYRTYTQGMATLLVDADITVNV